MELLEDKIRTLGNGEKARRVKRYYFANAFDAQLDAQGRILIPAAYVSSLVCRRMLS